MASGADLPVEPQGLLQFGLIVMETAEFFVNEWFVGTGAGVIDESERVGEIALNDIIGLVEGVSHPAAGEKSELLEHPCTLPPGDVNRLVGRVPG